MTASSAANHLSNQPAAPAVLETLPIEVALRRIAGFAELGLDWDSYGGAPTSPVARAEATRWVEIVADLFGSRAGNAARPYSVAPLADGGVQVEWRGLNGTVEIEVDAAGAIGYLFGPTGTREAQPEEADDVAWSDVLRVLLRALVGQAAVR